MLGFLIKRMGQMVIVLAGVSLITFLLMHLSPADPAQIMLGSAATPEAVLALRHKLGLDLPLQTQFLHWAGRVLRGDLGDSLWLQQPVAGEVWARFKSTAILGAGSFILAVGIGIGAGAIAALKRNSLWDRLVTMGALTGVSMPLFWFGYVLMILFSLKLQWLPPTGMHSPGQEGLPDLIKHMVLPACTLATISMAVIARMTRSSMIDVLREEHIQAARARGVGGWRLLTSYALKNALVPIISVIGVQTGHLLGGSVLTERVFAWPGVGSLLMDAIAARDFPLVQGVMLFTAILFSLLNLVTDLSYAWLDPRIRYE